MQLSPSPVQRALWDGSWLVSIKAPLTSHCGIDSPPVPLHQNTPADLMEQFFSLGISEAIYNIPFSQGLGA